MTDTIVSLENAGDASVAEDLIDDLLGDDTDPGAGTAADSADTIDGDASATTAWPAPPTPATVYGDAAYGTGEFLDRLTDDGIDVRDGAGRPPHRPRSTLYACLMNEGGMQSSACESSCSAAVERPARLVEHVRHHEASRPVPLPSSP